MMSGLLAVALIAVALAASAAPAGAVTPDTKKLQECYKKIQHQWVLEQKARANGNMKAVKMHWRKGLALDGAIPAACAAGRAGRGSCGVAGHHDGDLTGLPSCALGPVAV